jgi:hypothetical protein
MITYAPSEYQSSVDRNGSMYGYMNLPLLSVLKGETVLFRPFAEDAVPGVMSEAFPITLEPHRGQGHVYQIPGQGFAPNASIFVKVFYDIPANMSVEDRNLMIKVLNKYG